jgi:hypothetical protein
VPALPLPLRRTLLTAWLAPVPLAAQAGAHAGHAPDAGWTVQLGAQAIGVLTRVTPALGGAAFTEGYLTQPAVMGHVAAPGGRARLVGTLDLEGLTLRRGELTPGMHGEGYVDRRHPHSYVHELVASAEAPLRGARASLAAGRGFAPFGTDDPMVRPLAKFPVNHHLAQILERVVVIGAVRAGAVTAEVGAFNGDEPTGVADAPRWGRVGDSWAARLTLAPAGGAELQASYARVASPEFVAGGGTDQRKTSVGLRLDRGAPMAGRRYALVEWALTDDVVGTRRAFRYTSALAEAGVERRRWLASARLERTTRPEEERLADAFRSQRPHTDASILGITRWTIASAQLGAALPTALLAGSHAFVELSRNAARPATRPALLDPARFYGASRLWSTSFGVRLTAGARHRRMGRYGVAHEHEPPAPAAPHAPARR